ncbi:Long-chain-fatty-acid--CoA ligase [Sphingobium indicum BiD32]|uniref:3-methylmercaptopropionyl-CoA ligase n=1 Tax=Sphingobium indicum BiD32 TaxID=1301087 RepID=N1MKN4_9SPHN|nr:AMP-binding protein [Sphingobium indicum]CCW17790.1 Long-chain-fatty-acid--CoA ligase [Sphingobium indicum BiD32]
MDKPSFIGITLADLLLQAVRRHGGRVAIHTTEMLSYADLDERSDRLAAFLSSRGFGTGSRIALHLRNGAEYVVADLAILKLAAAKVPLNELIAPAEIAYCLNHAAVDVLIAHASFLNPVARQPIDRDILTIAVGDHSPDHGDHLTWAEVMSHPSVASRIVADPDDTAMIIYTGGTTGRPKGVRHSYGRLGVNLLAQLVCGDIRSDEVMYLSTPLPHSAGFHLQACLLQGGQAILAAKFDPGRFLDACEQYRVTWSFMVPTMIYRLLDAMDARRCDLSSVRTVVYGAAPMSQPRLKEGLRRFGPVFIQLYGQIESPNWITGLTKEDHLTDHLLASCGRAVPFVDVRIAGESPDAGEVEVRSPYRMLDYLDDRHATGAAFNGEWLRTGDLGYLDSQGYLFLVDRAKDMIISGGMNVYSVEVEAALRLHPDVREVAVVGLPDDDWGEAVTAVIVTSADPAPLEDLRRHAKQSLSAYKTPKRFVFLEEMPLTAFGKIDKKRLRTSLLTEANVDVD